jgi:hypothetical protein
MALQANQEKAQRLHDAGARASEAQTAVEMAAKHSEDVSAARSDVAAAAAACEENARVSLIPYSSSHSLVYLLSPACMPCALQ